MIGYSENTKAPRCKDDVPGLRDFYRVRGVPQPQHAPRKYQIFLIFRHTSTAENLGLDDDPDSQMKKVAEAAHPDFAVLVPSCREISISNAP